MKEKLYRVVWEIDIHARNPREAAEKALGIQRNPESIATIFAVQAEHQKDREAVLFGNFVFKHECRSYCETYVAALKILGEEPKLQWKPTDVVDAAYRTFGLPNIQIIDLWT